MPVVTIRISEEEKKILSARAKKNLLSLSEQIEDIIRKSAIRSKNSSSSRNIKVDDRLVSIFSRETKRKKKKS